MQLTTVITSYNRIHCIKRAIDSALAAFAEQEIVIVDDASSDNTVAHLQETYAALIASQQIKLVCMPVNRGVSAAKNVGYAHASGDWVIFLDSDDEYLASSAQAMIEQLKQASQLPIVFFRCQDHNGKFVGEKQGMEILYDIKHYVRNMSYGEALAAINKRLVGQRLPYIDALRGYEGLGCCRLVRDFGGAILSKVIGRVYYETGSDRLSVSHGMLKRMHLLAKGHLMLVREFWQDLGVYKSLSYLAKAMIYTVVGSGYRWLRIGK